MYVNIIMNIVVKYLCLIVVYRFNMSKSKMD